jgi:hypothetical protein
LATKGEVLDHFEHCLEVIRQLVRVDERFGWTLQSDDETGGHVRITCRSSDGRLRVVEAKQLIKAYGLRTAIGFVGQWRMSRTCRRCWG